MPYWIGASELSLATKCEDAVETETRAAVRCQLSGQSKSGIREILA